MLSILIPAYNAERYIGAALESAIAQQVEGGTQILVCDDGSTDGTAEIVRAKMRDCAYLKLFSLTENQGVCAARNRLLAEIDPATQFVAFLDADDLLIANAFLPGLQILQERPEIQMAYGRFYIVPTHLLTQGRPLSGNPVAVPGATLTAGVFRKALIDRVGSFDTSLRQGEDIDFLLRISEICDQIAIHDAPSFYYRRHSGNATLNYAAMRSGFMHALLKHATRRRLNPALHDGATLFRAVDWENTENAYQPNGNGDYTVVIPAYNAAKTIAETLQSILAQTVLPKQIIVVDDGSTDDTARIAADAGPLVKVISTPNQGSGAATTTGISMVDTAIVAMLDADDIWLPEKMEKQLAELLNSHPLLDAVLAKMTAFGDTHLKTAPTETSGWSRSTLVIWVESFLRVGAVRDMDHGYGEMVDWFGRANTEGLQFKLLDEPLAKRRIHTDSYSFRAGAGQAHDYLKVARLALERKRRQG
jgi:glycosyltransferase involved in cell wall biosynthesis